MKPRQVAMSPAEFSRRVKAYQHLHELNTIGETIRVLAPLLSVHRGSMYRYLNGLSPIYNDLAEDIRKVTPAPKSAATSRAI